MHGLTPNPATQFRYGPSTRCTNHIDIPKNLCDKGSMNLMLEIQAPSSKHSTEIFPEVIGELTRADFRAFDRKDAKTTKLSPLKRLSERHRNLARYIASGMEPSEVSAVSGYTNERINQLLKDQCFKNLVEFYSKERDIVFQSVQEQLAGMAKDAVEELQERLETDPESLSASVLIEMSKMGLDRTGHGPQSNQNVNVNVNLADRLSAARQRIQDAKVINAVAEEVTDAISSNESPNPS